MSLQNILKKIRLDQLLVERGLAESREKATRMILAGEVRVGDGPALKAGSKVLENVEITVTGAEKYVGRGGLKLEAALEQFGISVEGRVCLDVGASTGGFTDCLLQRGAQRVFAYDVGHSQLHWKIRQDSRVIVGEGINARYLQPSDFSEPFSLVVADVSFISLTLILPPVFSLLPSASDMVVLIKPQFELAREHVSRGGIIRDPAMHEEAVNKIRRFATEILGAQWCGEMPSPILGTKGNREFLAYLRKS